MDTFDIASEIEAINRTVGRRRIANGDGRSVVLRRSYDAPVEDVWDLTLLALGMHLAGQAVDPTGLEQTPEYRRFVVLSSTAWGAALEAAGMATAAEADAVVERTAAFYAPGA
jgi:hypothetical protein